MEKPEIRSLTPKDFNDYSVWYYEENRDIYYPITSPDEIPDYADPRDLRIKAVFYTQSGVRLQGYIVMPLEVDKVFSIGIFVDDKIFFFNHNLPDLSKEQLERMCKLINSDKLTSRDDVFPVRFETHFNFEGYNNFWGLFDAFKKWRNEPVQE